MTAPWRPTSAPLPATAWVSWSRAGRGSCSPGRRWCWWRGSSSPTGDPRPSTQQLAPVTTLLSPAVVREVSQLGTLALNLCGEYVCRSQHFAREECENLAGSCAALINTQHMRRSVLDILDRVKFIFGNLGELQCWLATVAGLQLEAEHRRKTTFASSLQQSLAQAEAGQQPHQGGMGLEEGLQYVIVTNAENPVLVFSFR